MEMSMSSCPSGREQARSLDVGRDRQRSQAALEDVTVTKPKSSTRPVAVPSQAAQMMELDDASYTFDPRVIPKAANIDTRNPKQVNAFMAARCVEMRLDLNKNTMLSSADRYAITTTLQQQIARMGSREFVDLKASQVRSHYKDIRTALNEGRPVSDRAQAAYARFNKRVENLMAHMDAQGRPLARKDAVAHVIQKEAKHWLKSQRELYAAYLDANSRQTVIKAPNEAAIRSLNEQLASGLDRVKDALPPRLKSAMERVAGGFQQIAASVKKSTDTLKSAPPAPASGRQYFDAMIEGMGRFADQGHLEYKDPASAQVKASANLPQPRETFRKSGDLAGRVTERVNDQIGRAVKKSVVDEFMAEYGAFDALKLGAQKDATRRSLRDARQSRNAPSFEDLKRVVSDSAGAKYSLTDLRDIHRQFKLQPDAYRTWIEAQTHRNQLRNVPRVGTYTPELEAGYSFGPRMR